MDWTKRPGTQDYNDEITANGEPSSHALPPDISAVCLNVATEMYNTEKSKGITAESVEGASITYGMSTSMLSEADKALLNKYKRAPITVGSGGMTLGFQY